MGPAGDPIEAVFREERGRLLALLAARFGDLDLAGIPWVIVGGESGPRARPMKLEWVRNVRDQCHSVGTAFFFKQWGGRTPKAGGRNLDGRNWDEYPPTMVAAAE